MKCDKSFKRHMLTVWGMRELGKGRPMSDVKADMAKWMKKTIPEVEAMVRDSKREARIAEKVAMEITKGLDGLVQSWQAPFPPVTKCCRCGGEARVGFVAHEGRHKDDWGPHLCDMRDNGGKGDLWPHDCVAVAVYFCRDCLETTALYNQA